MKKALAFSLIELLVVVAIICILAVLIIPAFQNISRGYRLQQAGSLLYGAIGTARQTAMAENRTTELWLIRNASDPDAPDAIRGIWIFRRLPDSTRSPIVKFEKLPIGIEIFNNPTYSSLLKDSPRTPGPTSPDLPGAGKSYVYWMLSFDPDGTTSFPPAEKCFVTLVPSNPPPLVLPSNFITIQIDPVNGIPTAYQP